MSQKEQIFLEIRTTIIYTASLSLSSHTGVVQFMVTHQNIKLRQQRNVCDRQKTNFNFNYKIHHLIIMRHIQNSTCWKVMASVR